MDISFHVLLLQTRDAAISFTIIQSQSPEGNQYGILSRAGDSNRKVAAIKRSMAIYGDLTVDLTVRDLLPFLLI